MSTPIVALEGVSRVYERPEGRVTALDGVTLAIEPGELVAITGPSGSGKSTLLHVLGLLDTQTAGSYRLAGADVAGLADDERARRRNREIGFVFQGFHLVSHLTVGENVELPLAIRGTGRRERAERARRLLADVGLAERVRHFPEELSGGEQQRAAIARALVTEPRLLLADEPTGNLDAESAEGVLGLFAAIRGRGTTVVVVTHHPRVAAAADRRHEIREGAIVGARPA